MSDQATPADAWELATLAAIPAWPLDRVLALPGRCKGSLLKAWGEHVRRRFGSSEADQLRAALGLTASDLPDAPDPLGWYPIAWQLALTRLISDRYLGGDLLALEPLLREDARSKQQRLIGHVLRLAVSPRRLLMGSERVWGNLYDRGRFQAEVGKHHASLRWSGAAFPSEPTWRVLQVFALRATFDALHAKEPMCHGRDLDDGFELDVRF